MQSEYNDSHIDTGPIEEHDVFSPAIAVNIASTVLTAPIRTYG